MDNQLKKELHQLIDQCDNELLLAEAKELLRSTPDIKDWWDELTQEDKNILLESEAEYEKGNVIKHEDLMNEFKAWKKK
jgi:hypothetical protein